MYLNYIINICFVSLLDSNKKRIKNNIIVIVV